MGAFDERFQHVAQIVRYLHFVGARSEIEQRTIDIEQQRFVLREKLADMSVDALQALTGAELVVGNTVGVLSAPEV